jgi:hypothetical protein
VPLPALTSLLAPLPLSLPGTPPSASMGSAAASGTTCARKPRTHDGTLLTARNAKALCVGSLTLQYLGHAGAGLSLCNMPHDAAVPTSVSASEGCAVASRSGGRHSGSCGGKDVGGACECSTRETCEACGPAVWGPNRGRQHSNKAAGAASLPGDHNDASASTDRSGCVSGWMNSHAQTPAPRTSINPSECAEAIAFILRISLVAARPEAVCSTTTCAGRNPSIDDVMHGATPLQPCAASLLGLPT